MIDANTINQINEMVNGEKTNRDCGGCLASYMYYDTIEEQITSIVYSINNSHYYFNGNKRTALIVFTTLCTKNGLTHTSKDLGKLLEEIAKEKLTIPEVAEKLFDKKFPKKSNLIKIIKSKIVKKDNKYQVQSEEGKNLGTYDSKEEAEKRLKQVEYFKHKESAKTKKTSPKVKKMVKKPTKTTKKTRNTSKRFKIKPNKVLTKKPNTTIKPTKKPYKSQNKPVSKRYKIRTTTGEWPHQDVSLPVFEDLLEQGYDTATFVAHPGACSFCKGINGKTWSLQDLLNTTQYDAPIFSHSHVNAFSEIKVWDKNGELPDVYVNYTGEIS